MFIDKLKQNRNSLLYGTFILTAANVLVRFLGFIYRILLSRAIGPEGMGVFQLTMPVISIAFALMASGTPIAVSRLVAERKAVGDMKGVHRVFLASLCLTISISLLISLIVVLNINWISTVLLKEPRTRGVLFVLFPCIVVISIDSVLKGYFYGMKNFHHPAFAEIVEQISRIALVFILLYYIPSSTITVQAAIASFGMIIGEMASVLYLNYNYHKISRNELTAHHTPDYIWVLGSILKITLPITGVRLLSSIISSANSMLVPRRLVESGMSSSEAVSTFGILSGMVLPLLFLPFAFTNALSMVMIPNLSEDMAKNRWVNMRNKVSKAILITTLTAFPSSAVLFSLARPIGMLLYKQEQVGILLEPLACIAGLHGLQHTLRGILNGLGKQNKVARNFFIGGIIQIFCTWFLVAQPQLGIYGFIIGFIVDTLLVFVLNFITVVSTTGISIEWMEWFIKPGFASLLMGTVLRPSYLMLLNRGCRMSFSLFFSLIIGIVIFLLAIYATGSLSLLIQSIAPRKLKDYKKA
jgi:stage V sporulation protein B